jgi:protocatechuate 3,4-dioxygenase beta subunit
VPRFLLSTKTIHASETRHLAQQRLQLHRLSSQRHLIHPGRYKVRETFRPSHIHYTVEAKGYKTLITQLYFKGDPFNKTDRFLKDSLIIDPKRIRLDSDRSYELGVFDIVLKKA